MDKKIKMALLLDLYKALLTEKQSEALDLYYNEDLSLSEIAENTGITRQAVRDLIVKGERFLLETEEKTGIYKKIGALEERLKKISVLIKKNDEDSIKEIEFLSEIGE